MSAKRDVQLNVRVTPEVRDAIEKAAVERGMPMSRLVDSLLRESVERLVPADELKLTQ